MEFRELKVLRKWSELLFVGYNNKMLCEKTNLLILPNKMLKLMIDYNGIRRSVLGHIIEK